MDVPGPSHAATPAPHALTPIEWVICAVAAIGFAFDVYEILIAPLIVRPAIIELTGAAPGSPEFQAWVGRLFYVPALAGGVFGLLGGYLTDRFGRRRVLTYSILIYAAGAFLSGFSTSIEMLLLLRCVVFVGVCVEFVAAVAWLAALFPHPHQREKVLGYTQAFSSLGGFMVAVVNGLAVQYSLDLPAISGIEGIADAHAPWRYTLMSGMLPAIPLMIVRPFLPESPTWARKRAEGTLERPSFAALLSPELRRTTIVTTLMYAMVHGAAFGAIQQVPQIVPGVPEVQDATARLSPAEAQIYTQETAADVTKVQETGGLAGRLVLAALAVRIASRRTLVRIFQVPGLVLLPIVFVFATTSLDFLSAGIFLVALLTIGQMSFWGNYLPRAFPLHLRGTGESFAANIGGRLIGTSFAWITATLAVTDDGASAPARVAMIAAGVGFAAYLVNFAASFWLPEPKEQLE